MTVCSGRPNVTTLRIPWNENRGMKIVLAPDSFKGSLSAEAVCAALETGLRRVLPSAEIVKRPMADGGEGTLDAVCHALAAGQGSGARRKQALRLFALEFDRGLVLDRLVDFGVGLDGSFHRGLQLDSLGPASFVRRDERDRGEQQCCGSNFRHLLSPASIRSKSKILLRDPSPAPTFHNVRHPCRSAYA